MKKDTHYPFSPLGSSIEVEYSHPEQDPICETPPHTHAQMVEANTVSWNAISPNPTPNK